MLDRLRWKFFWRHVYAGEDHSQDPEHNAIKDYEANPTTENYKKLEKHLKNWSPILDTIGTMPYIKQADRPKIDELIAPLAAHIKSLPLEAQDGALNYAVTRLLKEIYEPKYFNYNRAMGVLSSIQAEWYRRDVAAYEDAKIIENGDV